MALARRGGRVIRPSTLRSSIRPSNIALQSQGSVQARPQTPSPGIDAWVGMYPAYSDAMAFGMTVGTWNQSVTPELVAKLYRFPDLSTPVVTLDSSLARSWQDELSETGSGQISFMADDSDLSSFEDDGDDIIVFTYRDHRAFAMLAERKSETVVSQSEESDESITYSGRGLLALFERILVYPTGGVGRKPIEEDRPFNWTSPSYDDSAWGYAVDLGGIRDMCNVAAFLLGVSGEQVVTELPNEYYTVVLWAPGGTLLGAPLGKCYFRQTITVPADGPYRIFLGCDDEGTLFIDGQEVTSVKGVNWFGVSSVDVDLTAGSHLVCAVVENQNNLASIVSGDPGINPGKFVFQVYQLNIVREALPENLIAASNHWQCKCAPYPPEPPGMTVGQVLRLCIEEAQTRGYLTSLVLNFTDTVDSDGKAWPVSADIATKTGTDVLTFMRELSSTYCDLWMDPTTLKLWAWIIDGRGTTHSDIEIASPSDPEDPESGNLLSYQKESEYLPVGAFLLRWKDGWSERTSASSISSYGRRETLLEIGAPTSIEEIYRVADKQFVFFATPRTSMDAGTAPILGADEPYLNYKVGDEIVTPDGNQRVLAITMKEDETTGIVTPTLTLRNVILGAMERAWNALRKVS